MRSRFKRRPSGTVLLAILLALGLWAVLRRSSRVSRLPADAVCIDSFDTFAFTFPKLNADVQARIPPQAPWVPVEVPTETSVDLAQSEVMVVRPERERDTLWLMKKQIGSGDAIYTFDWRANRWRVIPQPVSAGLPPVALPHFSETLNTVIGIGLDSDAGDPRKSRLLRFAFDDVKGQFDVEATLPLPSQLSHTLSSAWAASVNTRILVMDQRDDLWLFMENDAIYRLDFTAQRVERLQSLAEISSIHDVMEADSDRFFFSGYHTSYAYDALAGTLTTIAAPFDENYSTAVFLDASGTLWSSDALWKRTPEGVVETFHPHPRWYLVAASFP